MITKLSGCLCLPSTSFRPGIHRNILHNLVGPVLVKYLILNFCYLHKTFERCNYDFHCINKKMAFRKCNPLYEAYIRVMVRAGFGICLKWTLKPMLPL